MGWHGFVAAPMQSKLELIVNFPAICQGEKKSPRIRNFVNWLQRIIHADPNGMESKQNLDSMETGCVGGDRSQ